MGANSNLGDVGGDLRELLFIAKRAALAGGREILRHLSDFSVTRKGDNSPVTDADLAANAAISRELAVSGHAVCSEEAILPHEARVAAARRGGFWLIDPLDGTRGFVRGSGEFCVCVAFIDAGANAALGVLFSPILARMWAGVVADGGGYRGAKSLIAASANAFLAENFGADLGDNLGAGGGGKIGADFAKTGGANSNLGADFTKISREFLAFLDENFRARFGGTFCAVFDEIITKNLFEIAGFAGEFGANSNLGDLATQNHANLRRVFAAAPEVLYGSGERLAGRFCGHFGLGGGALGSALKFALLAAQQSRVLLKTYGTKLWDTAAGEAVLNAAGGGLFALNSPQNPATNSQHLAPNPPQNPAPNPPQNRAQISPRAAQNSAQKTQNLLQNPAQSADFLAQTNYLSPDLQNPHFIALSRAGLANLPLYARFLQCHRQ